MCIRFEDSSGGIYEYSVKNASISTEPSLEKRAVKLHKAVARRAQEASHDAQHAEFQRPPSE